MFQVEFLQDPAGYVVVHTDGACSNNGKASAKVSRRVLFFLSWNTNFTQCRIILHPDPDPDSDFYLMRIRILVFIWCGCGSGSQSDFSLDAVFGLKILKFFDADLDLGSSILSTLDPGSERTEMEKVGSLILGPVEYLSYRTYRWSCMKYVWKGVKNFVQRRYYSIGRARETTFFDPFLSVTLKCIFTGWSGGVVGRWQPSQPESSCGRGQAHQQHSWDSGTHTADIEPLLRRWPTWHSKHKHSHILTVWVDSANVPKISVTIISIIFIETNWYFGSILLWSKHLMLHRIRLPDLGFCPFLC